jgi:hypothetical protein
MYLPTLPYLLQPCGSLNSIDIHPASNLTQQNDLLYFTKHAFRLQARTETLVVRDFMSAVSVYTHFLSYCLGLAFVACSSLLIGKISNHQLSSASAHHTFLTTSLFPSVSLSPLLTSRCVEDGLYSSKAVARLKCGR